MPDNGYSTWTSSSTSTLMLVTSAPRTTITINASYPADKDMSAIQAFRRQYPTSPAASLDPLYVLPETLVKAVETIIPGFLNPEEVRFEEALRQVCLKTDSIGIAENSFVQSNELLPILKGQNAKVGFDELAKKAGLSEKVTSQCKSAAKLLFEFVEDMRAYLGWLITNPKFVAERDELRERRMKTGTRQSFKPVFDQREDIKLKRFCRKWNLIDLRSWEVFIAQGPNLAGVHWPESSTNLPGQASISIPPTVKLRSDLPLRKIITDVRKNQTPVHLQGWQHILDREVGTRGMGHYVQVFVLHFYLNVVFRPRFGDRLHRKIGRLDDIFAEFMCLGTDRIRQIRHDIDRRLAAK